MIRPVKDYKVVIGTQKEREGVHMLFEKYQSRTKTNLEKRLDVLKWPRNILDVLISKGFIEKATWRIDQIHYLRKLFRKHERST